MDSSVIMWFRRDLRLDDNPAWAAATSAGAGVTPLLVIEPGLLETAGPHRRRAFLTAADALDRALTEHGARLHVRTGNPATILPALANDTGASTVFANADVSRWAQRRDAAVESALGATPIEWHWGTLAHAPGTILTQSGTLSKVFTPFAKRWFAVPLRPEAQPGTASLASDPGDGLPELDNPRSPSLSDTRVDEWQADIDAYATTRDLPAIDGTSRLSTALRFGTVSPRSLA
ncbi:MAG: deoxyribodipyrimidine photo-lyase, partial [Actinomycetota bacterium]